MFEAETQERQFGTSTDPLKLEPAQALAWAQEEIGSAPFRILNNRHPKFAEVLTRLGRARLEAAVPWLQEVATHHPDASLIKAACDTLLFFEGAALDTVIQHLNPKLWDGGPAGQAALWATFKREPSAAIVHLEPLFAHIEAHPDQMSLLGQDLFTMLLWDIAPPAWLPMWRQQRRLPLSLLELDPQGWRAVCHRFKLASPQSLKFLPLTLLVQLDDPEAMAAHVEAAKLHGFELVFQTLAMYATAEHIEPLRDASRFLPFREKRIVRDIVSMLEERFEA